MEAIGPQGPTAFHFVARATRPALQKLLQQLEG